jgi:hypothetical protein
MPQSAVFCALLRGFFFSFKCTFFYLFFQFTMIPETAKDPGSICTIASASRVLTIQDHSDHFLYLIFMYLRQLFSDAFGRSDSSFSLSEFHIALDAEVRSIQPVKFLSRAGYLRLIIRAE